MKRRWLVALGVLIALNSAAAEKWALLVGINDYTHGPEQWDLRGCENDVRMTRDLLVSKYGFPPENIRLLLSGEATAANIKAGIEDWLIARSRPEDIVYFHFSGHGSQVTDRDGDEPDDGKDEMICPADMQRGKVESIITDDELRGLLERVPSQNVTVILDACHSGSGTRDLSLSRSRFVEFEEGGFEGSAVDGHRAVVMTPTSDAAPRPATSSAPPAKPPEQKPPANKLSGSGGMETGKKLQVTISGCKPDQTSADAWIREGFYAGALTYHLVENMKTAPADITYRQLMDRVIRDMSQKYTQNPQIDGDMDRPLFGTAVPAAVSIPFVPVTQVQHGKAILNGGAAQKITVGSVYAVYPAGETQFRGQPRGQIRVSRVEPDWAEADILEQAQIQAGDRAKEIMHRLDVNHINLLVEGEADLQTAVIQALATMDIVKTVPPGAHFDHRLKINTEQGFLTAFLTRDGEPGTPVRGANAAILVANLRPQLENAFAIKYLAHLENPNPVFKVEVWGNRSAEADGLDQAPDEKWVEARVGDAIRFNFRAERDCYLTLINVGTSGKITVLFPNKYQPDGLIRAGRVYSTETPGEMPFKIRAHGPAGRELVKVVATLKPLDLSSLQMGQAGGAGTRSIESGSSFARQLSRDLAIEGLDEGNIDVTLLPTDTWSSDYMIIDTTP